MGSDEMRDEEREDEEAWSCIWREAAEGRQKRGEDEQRKIPLTEKIDVSEIVEVQNKLIHGIHCHDEKV